ncbi:tetratricopeptide repeat protein [Acidovorax soli]|uniref:tetratricopeptide repeat protein n=1 Tax=Acidovorax soli TaxID=592050 RepID=UPI0032B23466
MTTSKDVFAKRKEGAIDEAYQLALQLMASPEVDEWDRKALGWCLVDLIKRDAQAGHPENLEHYRRQLEGLQVAADDEVLQKGIRNALLLCSPNGQLIRQASTLSKEGRHAQAVTLYRQAGRLGPLDSQVQTNLGWDLYRHAKQLLDTEPVDFSAIRRNLHDYLKLDVEKPSLLHTCFLQQAAKLASQERLNLLKFLPLWGLQHLRAEDYQRHRAEDGKEYPSLAEKVIQQAGKEAAASGDAQDLNYILPYLDAAIERFPDNVWLKLDKAKGLLGLGRHDDALAFGMAVTKAKANEYWAWELLGDIVALTDPAAALGCYCKALCCPADDKFTGKVRLKLAQSMIETHDFPAAKLEVETVLRQKEREGQRVPEAAERIASQPWFASTLANASNADYYRAHAGAAETLLLSQLPWIEANLGDRFVIPGMENKPKRKIFIKTQSDPLEASIPEWKLGHKAMAIGDGLQVKGEFNEKKRFQIYALEARPIQARWDIFPRRVGVVYQVNKERQVLHFIVDRTIDGVIPLAELPGPFKEGDAIAVKVSKRSTDKGTMYRVLHAEATQERPAPQVRKEFKEAVRLSNGMGFTDSDIFIPPPLVVECQLLDGQKVAGTAILNFNKKHRSWGWKAIALDGLPGSSL